MIIVVYLLIDYNLVNDDENDNNLWKDINVLQWAMLIIYAVFVVVVLILNSFMLYYSHYESYVLPNNSFQTLSIFRQEFAEYVRDYCYPQLMIVPIRDFLVREAFGKDVGSIVLSYLYTANDDSMIDNFKEFLIKYKGKEEKDSAFRDFGAAFKQ